jgi:hypothetical protein
VAPIPPPRRETSDGHRANDHVSVTSIQCIVLKFRKYTYTSFETVGLSFRSHAIIFSKFGTYGLIQHLLPLRVQWLQCEVKDSLSYDTMI